MKDILASHNSLEGLENPEKGVAVRDQNEVALKRSSLALSKSLLEDKTFIEGAAKSGMYRNFTFDPLHSINLEIS